MYVYICFQSCVCISSVCQYIWDSVSSILPLIICVTGGYCLSQIFWGHENMSSLSVIWLIYIKLYRKKRKEKFCKKIWAKWESGLTAVQLKWDPPVIYSVEFII